MAELALPTPMAVEKQKNVLFDLIRRYHDRGLDRDTFEAIFDAATQVAKCEGLVQRDDLRDIVMKHLPKQHPILLPAAFVKGGVEE
jgi:hypothetical protein